MRKTNSNLLALWTFWCLLVLQEPTWLPEYRSGFAGKQDNGGESCQSELDRKNIMGLGSQNGQNNIP